MTAPKLLAILLVVFTTYIPSAVGQISVFHKYGCSKYCNTECGDYFPGPQFSECVQANVHCSCHTEFSTRNPFMIFLIFAIIFVTLFLCAVGCQICKRYNPSPSVPHRVVAHPVVPAAVVTAVTNNRRSSHTTTSNNTSSSSSRTPQRGSRGFVNPIFVPQKPGDYPPEYLPPPPYNECVIDIHSQENSGKASTKS